MTRASSLLMAAAALVVGALAGFAVARLAPGAGGPTAADPAAPAPPDDSPVVIVAGDQKVTRDQLEARWRQLPAAGRAYHDQHGGRQHFADEVVEDLLLAQEARVRGMDRRLDVREAMRSAADKALARPLLADEVRRAALPESEVRAFYAAHPEGSAAPARVEVREIVATFSGSSGANDDTPDAASARAKIERLRAEAVKGDFAAIAQRSSEAPTASQGGRVGWVEAGKFPAAYASAALALAAGEVSPVIEMPDRCLILQAVSREEARVRPFEEMRDELQERLLADDPDALGRRYRAFVGSLREHATVRIDAGAMASDPPARASAATGASGP